MIRATLLLAASLTLALTLPAFAEEQADVESDGRKRALALKVMEVTGATAQGEQVARSLLSPLRPYFPTVPEETWDELRLAFDVDQIVELSIPIYTRNFDEQELKDLVEFYQSPLGRKVIERMPLVMQESMMAFNNWNQQKLREVVEKLQSMGYQPVDAASPGMTPAPPQQ